MVPGSAWDGNYDANGGYLIVLSSGEIISYHIFDKKEFEDYLFNNTKLETPSASRYGIGEVYSNYRSKAIMLNLQIRFKI